MAKKFKAKVVEEESALGWRIVNIPFDVKKAFGIGGRVPVRGTVNDFAFRTSLFPRKNHPHFLMLNKQMQKGAGVDLGDAVTVTVELDQDERTVEVPELFQTLLEDEPELAEFFDSLNYSTRKWIVDWMNEPKSDAAKERRAEQMMVRIIQVRDGEITPPPILQSMFAGNPKAKVGWKKLPASHKRAHLFGIFSSQNPDTRKRRAEKAVEMMVEYANK